MPAPAENRESESEIMQNLTRFDFEAKPEESAVGEKPAVLTEQPLDEQQEPQINKEVRETIVKAEAGPDNPVVEEEEKLPQTLKLKVDTPAPEESVAQAVEQKTEPAGTSAETPAEQEEISIPINNRNIEQLPPTEIEQTPVPEETAPMSVEKPVELPENIVESEELKKIGEMIRVGWQNFEVAKNDNAKEEIISNLCDDISEVSVGFSKEKRADIYSPVFDALRTIANQLQIKILAEGLGRKIDFDNLASGETNLAMKELGGMVNVDIKYRDNLVKYLTDFVEILNNRRDFEIIPAT